DRNRHPFCLCNSPNPLERTPKQSSIDSPCGEPALVSVIIFGGGILYRNTDVGNVHLGPVRQETAASLPTQHSALSPRPVRWPQAARQFLFWLRSRQGIILVKRENLL